MRTRLTSSWGGWVGVGGAGRVWSGQGRGPSAGLLPAQSLVAVFPRSLSCTGVAWPGGVAGSALCGAQDGPRTGRACLGLTRYLLNCTMPGILVAGCCTVP